MTMFDWCLGQLEHGYGDPKKGNGFALHDYHSFYTVTMRREKLYIWYDPGSKLVIYNGRTVVGTDYTLDDMSSTH